MGQPKAEVYREVEYLRSLHAKIADILGISRATLYRRLDEWQLSRDAYYSTVSDADLDQLVHDIKVQENPNIGEVMLMAALKSIPRYSSKRLYKVALLIPSLVYQLFCSN